MYTIYFKWVEKYISIFFPERITVHQSNVVERMHSAGNGSTSRKDIIEHCESKIARWLCFLISLLEEHIWIKI